MGHWQVIECERMDIEYQVPFFLGDYMSMWLYPNKKKYIPWHYSMKAQLRMAYTYMQP